MKDDFLIDEFYKETVDEGSKCSEDLCISNEKMQAACKALQVLDEDPFDMDIDILTIIDNAESIKNHQKNKMETILFGIISTILISLYIGITMVFGSKIFLISQAIMLVLLPWTIIPISIIKMKGSES